MKIGLTSVSAIKANACKTVLGRDVECIKCTPIENVEQPVEIGGLVCCKNRIQAVLENGCNFDVIVSIENAIERNNEQQWVDVVHVMVYDSSEKIYYYHKGHEILIDPDILQETSTRVRTQTLLGWDICIGQVYAERNEHNEHNERNERNEHNERNDVPSNNWMKKYAKVDRHDQIKDVLYMCWKRYSCNMMDLASLMANIDYHCNFPKQDVLFQDLSSILAHPQLNSKLFQSCLFKVKKHIDIDQVDAFVGLDARGFIFAQGLASLTKKGMIMARKPGKLPGITISETYLKEYGSDEMEIKIDNIRKDQKVVVVDDLVATGGSLKCIENLLKKLGVTILANFCVCKVDGLFAVAQKSCDNRIITLF